MKIETILPLEDNPQDKMLTQRALRKINLAKQMDVVRDGQQALDYPVSYTHLTLPTILLV